MDDVRGYFLEPLHSTPPAAVSTNINIKLSSFKSSENIQEKEGGPDSTVSNNQFSSLSLSIFITSGKHVLVINTPLHPTFI